MNIQVSNKSPIIYSINFPIVYVDLFLLFIASRVTFSKSWPFCRGTEKNMCLAKAVVLTWLLRSLAFGGV